MLIVHFCRRFWPEQGGVETHVERVSLELIRRGHKVKVITLQPDSLDYKQVYKGIEIFRIPVSPTINTFAYKWTIWRWLWLHREVWSKANIVQIHDVFWWVLPFILFIRHKTFMTFHGYEPPGPPTFMQRCWHQIAAKLTKGSLGIGSFHQKWYGVKPTFVSFGAADQEIWRQTKKTSQNSQKNKIKCMYLGRLSEDVGIMSYLEGINQLYSENKHDSKPRSPMEVNLDIYGTGEQASSVESYVFKHRLPVKFKGEVPQAARFSPDYDIVFASRHLAILETLSTGSRIIANYNNQIKMDYLLDKTPFSEWIQTFSHPADLAKILTTNEFVVPKEAINWARAQTWAKLTKTYESLWTLRSSSVQ